MQVQQQQEKEWKDFRKDAVIKGDKEGLTEDDIFCLWVIYHLELKNINVTDYVKAIMMAAQMTEQSPELEDGDEEYIDYCLDTLNDRGLIVMRDTMPFIKQIPNDYIKGGLYYVH